MTAHDRTTALARARRALREFRIEGVASVLPFHRAVLDAPEFTQDFAVHTRWIETDFADRLSAAIPPAGRVAPPEDAPMLRLAIEIDGKRHDLALPRDLLAVAPQGEPSQPETSGQPNDINAPVAGILSLWKIANGAEVEAGQQIAVIEAMKMETSVEAPRAGRLMHLAAEGETLAQGGAFARVDPVNLPR